MKLTKHYLLLTIITILASCTPEIEKGNTTDVFTEVYNPDNLNSQSFVIDNSINNFITGSNGSKLKINKGIFQDSSGKTVIGEIEINLIEALNPIDRILGNLTTTYQGKPLETGGMIFISASANDHKIVLREGKSIFVKMPTDSTLGDMSLFTGVLDSTVVKWVDPVKLQKEVDEKKVFSFEKTTNVIYNVVGFDFGKVKHPPGVDAEVSRIAWAGDGLKITKDSSFKIDKYTVRFYKNDTLQTWSQIYTTEKGKNSFAEDINTNYFFSVKKLGWANIDRLLSDPRTQEVELITSIENGDEFELVYVTLITQNMYLPGYQKKDGSYGFSHSDEEPQRLPVGESATILATAYKEDVPFFAIRKIVISEKLEESFLLAPTTKDGLKTQILEGI
jgi:hypothetical protein